MTKISKREVERQYNKMLKIESLQGDVEPNRINNYVCNSCKTITKTIDLDKGVTPFMHSCKSCNETAISTFYEDIEPRLDVVEEWYRPSLKECLKLRNKPNVLDYVFQGGLLNRKLVSKNV